MTESQREQRQMQRRHVFIVNGAPEMLNLVRELLQDEHYNVTTTNFVPQTFAQIAALQPSLLVVDLVIGRTAGWDLLEHLQREASTRQIPVIVTSTDSRLLERAKAEPERFGGNHYIVKPFLIDELVDAVRALIGPAEPKEDTVQ